MPDPILAEGLQADRIQPERAVPGRRWYHSLYWRIALGFILCVAGLLVAQGTLFVWLLGRATANESSRSPAHFATVVASNLADALESDPSTDLGKALKDEFGRSPHRLLVVMKDGRVFRNRDFPVPEWLIRAARFRLMRASSGDGPPPPGASGSRRGLRRPPLGPIVVDGVTVGMVSAVPGPTPAAMVLAELGPTLAAAGVVLLLLGTATMAFFVFRPARRRLRELEQAAQALGAGKAGARAPEGGGDEVSALARSFNQMAADLEARVGELQEADRARRQLLADVSHELMTPLTAMRGYLETLALPAAVPDDATRERYVGIVTEETLRLESIIGDLLDLARLEGGGGELQRGRVAVESLFSRAAARHAQALADKSLHLETRIGPGADAVDGDARRLEQAVQNLVANAVRHTPSGGRISVTAAARGNHEVVLQVEDTGPGIAPEHLPHVFDRFYPRLRPLLSRRRGPRSGLRRQRTRPLDRPRDRPAPRRHGQRVARASRRRTVRAVAADMAVADRPRSQRLRRARATADPEQAAEWRRR
jgi:two-component system, OmpR family, sensor kinase